MSVKVHFAPDYLVRVQRVRDIVGDITYIRTDEGWLYVHFAAFER